MKRAFDWNDIALILALGRTGSKSATARIMWIDDSTVGRRIAAAEVALQVRLFSRSGSAWRLTDAGQVFAAQAAGIDGAVRSMLLATNDHASAATGSVRLSTIDFLLDHWLMAHIPALTAANPSLDLKLQGDNDNLSFMRDEADLALRLSRPDQDAALRMRKLGTLGLAVYGAAALPALASGEAAQWHRYRWLTYGAALGHLPEMRWIERHASDARCAVQTGSVSTMLRACQEGAGLALLPCLLGDGAGYGLRRLSAGAVVQRELWLLRHRDAGAVVRINLVAAWLAERYKADAGKLRGEVV